MLQLLHAAIAPKFSTLCAARHCACCLVLVTFAALTAAPVWAESIGKAGGTWPESWPAELEPLRKQAWTWVGGLVLSTTYEIPFDNRAEFESAWPYILKLKSDGASLTLSRGPRIHVKTAKVAGVRIFPSRPSASTGQRPVTRIELVVDGKIVDLNRIRLPAKTPIIDRRFKDLQPSP